MRSPLVVGFRHAMLLQQESPVQHVETRSVVERKIHAKLDEVFWETMGQLLIVLHGAAACEASKYGATKQKNLRMTRLSEALKDFSAELGADTPESLLRQMKTEVVTRLTDEAMRHLEGGAKIEAVLEGIHTVCQQYFQRRVDAILAMEQGDADGIPGGTEFLTPGVAVA